jgi:arginine N-succinyltransferase
LSRKKDLYIIRPIETKDAESLLSLVVKSSGGLSSLQPRLNFLKDYIKSSEKSFSQKHNSDQPCKYLLGMYEGVGGKLIGCAAVKTKTGINTPFINFDILGEGDDQHLKASSRFMGSTEVGSLYLDPDYRSLGLGSYLARVRYLLMATEPWRFDDCVIAELRGICGIDGSPLYDHIFKDKLEKNFMEADTEYFDRNPKSLGDIVPIGKLNTCDMPINVRASLGQPNASGQAAMRLLQSEGFIFTGTVDLFDGGPIMSVHRDTIRTIMNSKVLKAKRQEKIKGGVYSIVTSGDFNNFRAVITKTKLNDDKVNISFEAFDSLNLQKNNTVRYWHTNEKNKIEFEQSNHIRHKAIEHI